MDHLLYQPAKKGSQTANYSTGFIYSAATLQR